MKLMLQGMAIQSFATSAFMFLNLGTINWMQQLINGGLICCVWLIYCIFNKDYE